MNILGGLGSSYAKTSESFNKFDFYSGSQITIWFGNILIDDINSIQWSRSQGKRPIYGYASQQFDSVAQGTVIIQGNFVINFRQKGYLPAVFDNIKDLYKKFNPEDSESKNPYNNTSWPVVKDLIGRHLKNGTFGPQTANEIKALGDSPDFLEQAKLYEQVIWGDVSLVDRDGIPTQSAADVAQSDMVPDGFNIIVSYGNTSGSQERTLNDHLQSTTKSIVGVHIIGESQTIQVGGQPVQEQYDFIARGTDEFLGVNR
jgi:hypothetical protein